MEKTIKLVMNEDKCLKIYVNDEEKHTIDAQNRSISADTIYSVFDFSIGDNYYVTVENEFDVDNQVLDFFKELLTDIASKVNAINTDTTAQ